MSGRCLLRRRTGTCPSETRCKCGLSQRFTPHPPSYHPLVHLPVLLQRLRVQCLLSWPALNWAAVFQRPSLVMRFSLFIIRPPNILPFKYRFVANQPLLSTRFCWNAARFPLHIKPFEIRNIKLTDSCSFHVALCC